MSTIPRLGPANHGERLAYEDFLTAHFKEGYQYELIGGKLYVAALPNPPQGILERWIDLKLQRYSDAHPNIINYVHVKTRVFLPERDVVSAPEPDVSAFHDFPIHLSLREVRWEDVSPFLVVEVVSPDDPYKDLIRNVRLYRKVPSIKEYWILDNRADPDRPTLQVHRRVGRRWRVLNFAFGETYTTPLLPAFSLVIDPHK
jgi:Uma2 family endonuclease